MFRDDAQANRAIQTLLRTLRLHRLWTEDGPTSEMMGLYQSVREIDGGPLSSGERILLLAAYDLWNGQGGIAFVDIVDFLHGPPLEALMTLTVAVGHGGTDVDLWIDEHAPHLHVVRSADSEPKVSHVRS
jgi:hypothetical protein